MGGTQPVPLDSRLVVNGRQIIAPIPPGNISLVLQVLQLAMQTASKSQAHRSGGEMKALRYPGDVHGIHADEKGPRVWVHFSCAVS